VLPFKSKSYQLFGIFIQEILALFIKRNYYVCILIFYARFANCHKLGSTPALPIRIVTLQNQGKVSMLAAKIPA
jgi:hypothetical protein